MRPALVVYAVACAALWAQDEKFATLDGVVTGIGGQPLPKTTLRLREVTKSSASAEVISDSEGKFHFVHMQPGFYELTGFHRGYLTTPYGQKHSRDEAIGLNLSAGKAANVTLQMIPGAILSGKVIDEDGDPVPDVAVKVFRSTYENGERRLHWIDVVNTDSRGQFQAAESLAPGQYWLSATKPIPYPAEKKTEDYVTTYYPGVADESAAHPLVLRGG